jgi:hypothetical protein
MSGGRVMLLLVCAIAVGMVGCGVNVQAEPATPVPTAGVRGNVKPGDATPTRDLAPVPTALPGDPNAPVSSETPITPAVRPNQTRISGRITDEQGNPIARARVTIPKSSRIIPEMAYLSKDDGTYLVSVPPGQYTLAVFAEGFAPMEQEADTRQEAQVELNWILKRE